MTEKVDNGDHRHRRLPFTLHALVVFGVIVIAFGPQVIWLIGITIRPNEVPTTPPTSEAITISAITGLFGIVGGAALASAAGRKRDPEDES